MSYCTLKSTTLCQLMPYHLLNNIIHLFLIQTIIIIYIYIFSKNKSLNNIFLFYYFYMFNTNLFISKRS